jgi:hypothetical protein
MRVLAIAVAALLVPGLAFTQSLGEVAARERAKKKPSSEKKAPVKVITEDDLRNARTSGSSFETAAPEGDAAKADKPADGAEAKPAGPKEKTEDELKAEATAAWRKKLEHAQSEVTRLQGVIDRLQLKLNDTSQPMYGGARTSQLAQMDEAKAGLAAAQAAVEAAAEEGRRAGYR